MRISDWSSDVCSSDLGVAEGLRLLQLSGQDLAAVGVADQILDLQRGLVGFSIELVRDLVEAMDDAPRDAVRDPFKAGVSEQVEEGADRHFGGKFRSEEHTSELQSLMRISYAVFCLKK